MIPASAEAATDTVSAGGFTFVSKTKFVDPGLGAVPVKCPKGTHALAGGYQAIADFGDVLRVFDLPIDDGTDGNHTPDDGWVSIVINQSGGPLAAIAEVTCSKAKPKYRTDSFPVPPNTQQNVIATCKGDETAIDLGVGGGPDLGLNSAVPKEDGSFSAYVDNHGDESESAPTIVVCLKAKTKLINNGFDINVQVRDGAVTHCPKHWFAVSGGQSNGGGFGQIVQTAAATLNPKSFIIDLDNLSTGPIGVNAVALCMKKLG